MLSISHLFMRISMSRNYGIGHRDIYIAGKAFLKQSFKNKDIGATSFGDLAQRWSRFSRYIKYHTENGIGRLERITRESVIEYGKYLADKVDAEEISAGYAQNLVSAINSVMKTMPTDWKSVGPVRDCHLPKRSNVRTEIPGSMDRLAYENARAVLRQSGDPTGEALTGLARELGLRSKEASLLDVRKSLAEAERTGAVTVTLGTKGGRLREIPMTTAKQMEALRDASAAQGNRRSLMPTEATWKTWREGGLRKIRETMQQHTGGGLHDLRAAYACERYKALTGHDAPVIAGGIVDRTADLAARQQIARELGHGRIDVVSSYIGGRS